jgi:sporadic carbohydrate cluster protein (TIGR04323 family)
MGERVPQHIQNLVVRNFCLEKKLHYMLSSTEYSMENSTLILEEVLGELNNIHGVVAYSIFQLPVDNKVRNKIYNIFLKKKKLLYFANENFVISQRSDLKRIENIWKIKKILPYCANLRINKKTLCIN